MGMVMLEVEVLMIVLLVLNLAFFFISGFDINFMDDVGQTILNWASAFGTYEMVGVILLIFV